MTELYEGRESESYSPPPPNTAPWIAVAILAIFAGVGTATISETSQPATGQHVDADSSHVRGISRGMVELTFNPRSLRGLRMAKLAFRFTYECKARNREAVRNRIENGWAMMESRVLRTLMQHTADQLKSDDGLDTVELNLRTEIDKSLFVDGIARTCEIQWEQILVQ